MNEECALWLIDELIFILPFLKSGKTLPKQGFIIAGYK
jgi:hypothetical protein